MHTIQLHVDDSVFDEFKKSLDTLPQDKLEIISDENHPDIYLEKDVTHNSLNDLLKEHGLSHFVYYEEPSRIVYTFDSGTVMQREDYAKVRDLLKANNIKHHDMGLDVLMIDKD